MNFLSIVIAALKRLLARLQRSQAQQAADSAAITRNEDAEHAVEHVEARPVVPVSVVGEQLRAGKF